MSDLLVIASHGGFAPVQARGTIAGHPFYFRARHAHWAFAVSETSAVDPVDIQTEEAGVEHGFFRESSYGSAQFDASYMSPEEAEAIIRQYAADYLLATRAG